MGTKEGEAFAVTRTRKAFDSSKVRQFGGSKEKPRIEREDRALRGAEELAGSAEARADYLPVDVRGRLQERPCVRLANAVGRGLSNGKYCGGP